MNIAAMTFLRYQYFQPLDDPETILLIDSWTDQRSRRISKRWWP